MSTLIALAFSLSTAHAQSYGGGGGVTQQIVIPWDIPGQRLANTVGCAGGMGYGVSDGKRKGGEGHICNGPYTTMILGGYHFGRQSRRAGAWFTAYNTIGGGWVGVQGSQGRFDGLFVYTRPSVGGGAAIASHVALEASVFLALPMNVLSVVGSGMDPRLSFPHVGLQASLLFGDFRRRDLPAPKTEEEHDAPLAIPDPAPSPPPDAAPARPDELPPVRDEDDESPHDEAPLAIPG